MSKKEHLQVLSTAIKSAILSLILGALLIGIGHIVLWYQYNTLKTLPNELATMSIQDNGLNEHLVLYFDASARQANGSPFSDGNYLLTLDTESNIFGVERLPAKGQQHEIHWNGYTSHYAMTALNTIGQQYQLYFAGIPIATGGHYVVRNDNGNRVSVVRDSFGMDLHDFVIAPNGNYLYLAAHTTLGYQDSTLTCLPKCGNLGQSIVETTRDGIEIYRYHLLDHYSRDDFIMDDMLIRGDWNLYDLTHANSLRLSPDGTQVIVSVRHTNEVISFNRNDGTVAWRTSDYTFLNDQYNGFSHQHDAQILDNGNLLLFDNGNDRASNSRAVEYEIDHEAQTLTLVWEYSNGQYQPNRGSVRLTENGNYVINWVDMDENDIEIVSASGDILYSVSIPRPYASYRVSVQNQ